jgi:hypothetical protein
LSEQRLVLQRLGSGKRGGEEPDLNDSICSLNKGIEKLSDYGGGTLGKKIEDKDKKLK